MPDGSISAVTQAHHSAALGGECIIDPAAVQALQEIAGDDEPEFLVEVIDLFLEDSSERIGEMQQAARSGDQAGVTREAHALKSASAGVGALALASVCEEIEAAVGEEFDQDLDGPVDRAGGMFAEVQRVLLQLKSCIQAQVE